MIYYLGIRFNHKTKKSLDYLRTKNDLHSFRIPNLNYHTTIMHSTTPFRLLFPGLPSNPIGKAKEVKLFGQALVVTYESDFCQGLHKMSILDGGTWSQKSFIPHITFAEDIIAINLQDIKFTPFPICIQEIFYREWPERRPKSGLNYWGWPDRKLKTQSEELET